MSKQVPQKKSINTTVIHSVIVVEIMILFRFLPISLPEVTPVGIEIIGIFIGTLYLWTTVDPLWSSLMSVAMIGLSSYKPMSALLVEFMGNVTIIQMLFLMLLAGALVTNKITMYIGRFFLTRKITNGRPWMFTMMICIGCFLMAAFVSPFAPIFLFWPVLYDIFEEVGYKQGEKYPKIALILVVIATLIGFPVAPYMNNGLALIGNFKTISEAATGTAIIINDGAYLFTTLFMGILLIIAVILFSKFVFRPDVGKLKSLNVEMLKKNPLPPLNAQQKVVSWGFIILIIAMLLPSVLPKTIPGMAFLAENTPGLGVLVAAALAAIQIDGKPALNITGVFAKDFSWSTFFLCSAAILIGGVMTNESTGITAFLNLTLSPLFNGMSPMVFTVVILIVAVLLTNLCNSLVIGMILQPVILTYCMSTGANAVPIVMIMIFFVLLSAAITPAASPFAAILHGNKEWVPSGDVYKYTLTYVGLELVLVLIIGIPVTNFLAAVMK